MDYLPTLQSDGRLSLVPFPVAVVEAILTGEPPAIPTAPDWPQEGTVFGLRMSREHGHAPGWMVVINGLSVGDCGIHGAPDEHGIIEIGYGLAASYRAQGFGTQVVGLMSDYLASLPEVSRVIAHTEHTNLPSQWVLIKNGFHRMSSDSDLIRFERPATP
jgi:RimJ/RimL family protein N-acetyltransferase